jgi:hypothetical protein
VPTSIHAALSFLIGTSLRRDSSLHTNARLQRALDTMPLLHLIRALHWINLPPGSQPLANPHILPSSMRVRMHCQSVSFRQERLYSAERVRRRLHLHPNASLHRNDESGIDHLDVGHISEHHKQCPFETQHAGP